MSATPPRTRRYTPEPVRTRRSVDERHLLLLDAAAAVVADSGLPALTMERLANAAGVSRALVYQHFANVGECLVELLEREWAWLEPRIEAGLTTAVTFADKVRAATKPYFDAKPERGPVFRALLLDRPADVQVRAGMVGYYGRVLRFWMDEAEQEYGIDRESAASAAVILIGGFEALALRYWSIDDADADEELEVFVQVVTGSMPRLARRAKKRTRP